MWTFNVYSFQYDVCSTYVVGAFLIPKNGGEMFE